jgi:Derlin-2/3
LLTRPSKATAGFYLKGYVFLQPLILAFAYTFSQDNPNSNVSIYIVTFQAKYLPFALLILTFILDGPNAALNQATGLVAAHLYDFLTRIWPTFGGGKNYIQTPAFVKRWFMDGTRPVQSRSYGTAFGRREQAPGNENWSGQRGPGRRLGGE